MAGRPARKTVGHVPAAMNGTLSIPEASAPRAFISGPKLNAYPVAAGRRIRFGTRNNIDDAAARFCLATAPNAGCSFKRRALCLLSDSLAEATRYASLVRFPYQISPARSCLIEH